MSNAPTPQPAPIGSRGGTQLRRDALGRFVRRSLQRNPARTIVAITGIALSCALITAIFTTAATLYSGLLNAELIAQGAWQVRIHDIDNDVLEDLSSDERVTDYYDQAIYGHALMPRSFEGYWGRYLTLEPWPTEERVRGLASLPYIAEGRAPQAPGELVLGRDLKGATTADGQHLYSPLPSSGRDDDVPRANWDGPIAVGTTIELAVGQRVYSDEQSGGTRAAMARGGTKMTPSPAGDVITEWLADAQPVQRFTVVGFYSGDMDYIPDTWSSNAGYLGFVQPDSLAARSHDVLITTNMRARDDISRFMEEYSNDDAREAEISKTGISPAPATAEPHEDLLKYQGIYDEESVWGSLYALAALLALIVSLASITLIYNAFAIAVAERTREYGLLASIGASARQIRATVFTEAVILAAIGIPLGIGLGILGANSVLSFASEGVSALVDQTTLHTGGAAPLTVRPGLLIASALLTAAAVAISAAWPALRAGRVPAIEAIRQTRDYGSRARRRSTRRRRMRSRIDEMRLRLFGVPGLLAHRSMTRGPAKSRAGVVSLAVAVALILISGSLSQYMDELMASVDPGFGDIDITLERTLLESETTADGIDAIESAYRSLGSVSGARPRGYSIYLSLYGRMEAGLLDPDDSADTDGGQRREADDGSIYTPVTALFVDAASWKGLLDGNGLDQARYNDPAHPVALGLNGTMRARDSRTVRRDPFEDTGSLQIFTHLREHEGLYFTDVAVNPNGEPCAYYDQLDDTAAHDDEPAEIPLSEALLDSEDIPIGAIITTSPGSLVGTDYHWPTIVLPATALPALAAASEHLVASPLVGGIGTPLAFHTEPGSSSNSIPVYLAFDVEDARAAEAAMRNIMAGELSDEAWQRTWLTNNAENTRTSRLAYDTIRLFVSCFTGITIAIAIGNVFNTLSNSLILRRREFAMLKSIGMDDRAFWRMITLECLSYALRGLLGGLAVGAGAAYFFYRVIGVEAVGAGFVLPLGWVLLAVALVAIVLAASTMFALRQARSDSIVTTLREESI